MSNTWVTRGVFVIIGLIIGFAIKWSYLSTNSFVIEQVVRFQTLIAGALAVLAASIGATAIIWSTRSNNIHQLARDDLEFHNRQLSMSRVLAAELSNIRVVLRTFLRRVENHNEVVFAVPYVRPRALEHLLGDMGLLGLEAPKHILKAYDGFLLYKSDLEAMQDKPSVKEAEHLVGQAQIVYNQVDRAIQLLSELGQFEINVEEGVIE